MTVLQVSTVDQKSTSTMDYAASEAQSTISTNDLPPAYQRPVSDSLNMAKTVSKTLMTMTAILGVVVLVAIYIQANGRGCSCYRGSESRNGPYYEPLTAESEGKERKRLPLSIQMSGTAGDLMKKISKGNVNCVVERKAATQIIASEPKMLITPYGNITTDPRLIHLSGEKMVFTCKKANNKEMSKRMKNKNDKFDSNEHEINETVESRSKRSTHSSKSECSCDCAC